MATVTQRVNKIKRPGTDYISPSEFDRWYLKSTERLSPIGSENVHPGVVGLVVDYLTRFILSNDVRAAFSVSLKGAAVCSLCKENEEPLLVCEELLNKVKGLDATSIESACKIATFDVWHRCLFKAPDMKGYEETNPNTVTIDNIRIMVERSLSFFEKYGPITKIGFDFYPNGYSKTITAGDGDYLTKDTLWDFKVSKDHPKSVNVLQVLTYWVMGQHSDQDIFKDIYKIGIYNPRLNIAYTYELSWMDEYLISAVEDNIICYEPVKGKNISMIWGHY